MITKLKPRVYMMRRRRNTSGNLRILTFRNHRLHRFHRIKREAWNLEFRTINYEPVFDFGFAEAGIEL